MTPHPVIDLSALRKALAMLLEPVIRRRITPGATATAVPQPPSLGNFGVVKT